MTLTIFYVGRQVKLTELDPHREILGGAVFGQTTPKKSSFARYTMCIKKTEQIGNLSQIRKAAEVMKFLVKIDYFGTDDVE